MCDGWARRSSRNKAIVRDGASRKRSGSRSAKTREVRVIWRSALSFASRNRLSILILHRVLPKGDPLFPNEPVATEFDELLRHIKSTYNVLRLSDAIERLQAGSLPRRALSISFDDGYADNLSVAAPILRTHGLPATLFITTGYLDGGSMWNDVVIEAFRGTKRSQMDLTHIGLGIHPLASIDDRRVAIERVLGHIKYLPRQEREQRAQDVLHAAGVTLPAGQMLSRDSVRELLDFGFEIGAHTVSHPILAKTPANEAWHEIVESKRQLEEILGRTVQLFAYPNGKPHEDYVGEHVRMVREAGFRGAVSTASGAAS